MNTLKMHSPNKVEENIKKIGELFPNCVTERLGEDGKPEACIDFDMLKQELSSVVVEGPEERYQFTWPDKKKSILLANAPISATLRPCREESVDFDTTENLYIEGDNLDVLKLLQETYLGKIKMIYIDPPYNTGSDFVYEDDFAESTEEYLANSGQFDAEGNRLFENTESNGRFHTDWLNMIYPRLRIAKDLLSDDGVIFISIDGCESDNLKKICDEIFGESNFIDCITWNTRIPKNDNKGLGNIHQYIVVYAKNKDKNRQFIMQKDGLDEVFEFIDNLRKKGIPIPQAELELKKFYNKKGYDRGITLYNSLDDHYRPWGKINMSWPNSDTFGPKYDVLHPITKKPTKKPDRGWRWNKETFDGHLDYEHTIRRYDGKRLKFETEAECAIDAFYKEVISTVVFSAMAIEAFFNDYAAACLGDSEFYDNFDQLSTIGKFELIAKFILCAEVDKSKSYYSHLKKLIKSRNNYIHNKSTELTIPDISIEDAIKADSRLAQYLSSDEDLPVDQGELNDGLNEALDALKAIRDIAQFFDLYDTNICATARFFGLYCGFDVNSTEEYRRYALKMLRIKCS